MNTKETLRQSLIMAMKEKRNDEKDILRVALGEIQSVESREGSITEEKCQKILKKIVDSNKQNLDKYSDNMTDEQKEKMEKENEILEKFITKTMTKDQIIFRLYIAGSPIVLQIEQEPNVGKCIGMAMKYFNSYGDPVDGKVVAEAVREMKSDGFMFEIKGENDERK